MWWPIICGVLFVCVILFAVFDGLPGRRASIGSSDNMPTIPDRGRSCRRCTHSLLLIELWCVHLWECNQRKRFDPLTGDSADLCKNMRSSNGACGVGGKLFEPQKPKSWTGVDAA